MKNDMVNFYVVEREVYRVNEVQATRNYDGYADTEGREAHNVHKCTLKIEINNVSGKNKLNEVYRIVKGNSGANHDEYIFDQIIIEGSFANDDVYIFDQIIIEGSFANDDVYIDLKKNLSDYKLTFFDCKQHNAFLLRRKLFLKSIGMGMLITLIVSASTVAVAAFALEASTAGIIVAGLTALLSLLVICVAWYKKGNESMPFSKKSNESEFSSRQSNESELSLTRSRISQTASDLERPLLGNSGHSLKSTTTNFEPETTETTNSP